MSIIETIDELLNSDYDFGYDGPNVYDITRELGGEIVLETPVDQMRWSTVYEIVVQFGDEYVLFVEERGSTENQENTPIEKGDYYLVEPREVTITKYVRV